jgi:hypothetical protein
MRLLRGSVNLLFDAQTDDSNKEPIHFANCVSRLYSDLQIFCLKVTLLSSQYYGYGKSCTHKLNSSIKYQYYIHIVSMTHNYKYGTRISV